MNKEKLKELANKLLFDMSDEEYETLLGEFNFIFKEMDRINDFPGISEVEPMIHPFPVKVDLRDDIVKDTLTTEESLKNTKDRIGNEIKVPKVVGD